MDGYQEEGLTYSKLNPQTIYLTDGLRCRKTDSGYVLEAMQADEQWHAITVDGGLPYVDVTLDPVQLTTAPFLDDDLTGPGFPVLDAPGEGLIVVPTVVDAFPSVGEPWGESPNDTLTVDFYYTSALLGAQEGTTWQISDNALTDSNDEVNPFYSPRRNYPLINVSSEIRAIGLPLIYNDPSVVVNAPLVMVGDTNGLIGGGIGARSVRYRIYYEIVRVIIPDNSFFRISAINQGTNTFTVADPYEGAVAALGPTFSVVGSTGNNQTYTKVSATFDTDHTDIVVTESIPDSTADGWVKQ